jgi:transglutaminase-like putative cysteine protease
MKYKVVHVTQYVYSDPVTLCHNQAHLTPRESARQKCISCQLDIRPTPSVTQPWRDAFGNVVTYFSIEQPHRELSVAAQSQVESLRASLPPEHSRQPWEEVVRQIATTDFRRDHDLTALVCQSSRLAPTDDVRAYALPSFSPGRSLFDAVLELTERIYEEFDYDPAATTISTPPTEILARRRGVCQDFANLQIAGLRSLGLLARYVSGYLLTQPPPGKPRLVGADASHAWVSVFFPNWGWVDFDPTNRRVADSNYITLAWGRDYDDVSPVRGVFLGGGPHQMRVSVDVAPVGN